MSTKPSKKLVAVKNPKQGRDYLVKIESPEFTCLCPMTGQPDFAMIKIEYIPDEYIVELKSLKLYLWNFRNEGHYHEDVTNIILDELVKKIKPKKMKVESIFNIRGGIYTSVICEYNNIQK